MVGRKLADELESSNVTVGLLHPGWVKVSARCSKFSALFIFLFVYRLTWEVPMPPSPQKTAFAAC
jgi:hypothetical protein